MIAGLLDEHPVAGLGEGRQDQPDGVLGWDVRDPESSDARRVRNELDAIRARFPDHA
nr:hypothetical protein [Mycobacterium sp.]